MTGDKQPGRSQPVRRGREAERSLSTVIGVVLLVGLVAAASVGILLVGGSATEESRDRAKVERIDKAFQEFASRIETVARGNDDERVFEFDLPPRSGDAVRESNAGRIVVERANLTTGTSTVLANQSLGAVVYSRDGTTIAYQAGAVWRGTGRETTTVSQPPFSYATTQSGTEPTLTLPLVTTTGDRRISSGDVRLSDAGIVSPLNDQTIVEGDLVVVTIKSEFYVGWANYFRQSIDAAGVSVDHANETVRIEMVVPTKAPPVEGGVVQGGAAETLKLKQQATIDSYNSSDGTGYAGGQNNTRVIAAGDVNMKQDSQVKGSLEVGGEITFGQNATITGGLAHSGAIDYSGPASSTLSDHVDGWTNDNASVDARTAVDGVIDQNIALIRDNSDNVAASNVSGTSLEDCSTLPGNTCRLGSGAYLLNDITLDTDETLILDTTGGPIDIAVLDNVELVGDASIEVVGNGRVNVYLNGETGSKDLFMKDDAKVTVPDDRSPQFWLYMDTGAEARLRGSTTFTGIIYGPSNPGGTGTEISMSTTSRIDVYGAVVGDVEPITQEVRIHYDEALATATPIQTATAIPRLTFIQVSVYRVSVEDD